MKYMEAASGDGRYGYGGSWEKTYAYNEIAQFVNMFGGDYFDWTKAENKEAIQFMKDMVDNNQTPIDQIADKYEQMNPKINDGKIGSFFMNSVIITIMTLAVQLIVIILASFALGKLRPWGSGFIEILFLSGLFITSEMLTIPNFTTLKAWGLNGTRLALLLPYVTLGLPTATFIMINYVKGLPKELDEAALLDGCSLLQNLFRITLPLLKPVIATVMIFNFQGTWSEFYWALIEIKKDSLKTLPLGLMNFNSMYNTDYGVLCAGLCIATIPVVLLYLKCSSYFIGGMVAGAVKG